MKETNQHLLRVFLVKTAGECHIDLYIMVSLEIEFYRKTIMEDTNGI